MAVDLNQFGPRLNVWAMLKNLVSKNMGFFTLTSGSPTSGTSGTYAGYAATGAMMFNEATGAVFINTGTLASPTWSSMGAPVSALGGLGTVGVAKMTYSFAVDGGAIATITPAQTATLPVDAIILGGVIDVTTQLTSGGAATIALGLGSGAQAASLLAATAVASWTVGTTLVVIPKFTAATWLKVAATTSLTLTVAAFALTAGRFDVNVVYVQGNAT